MPSIVISVNGELRDAFKPVPDGDAHASPYTKVALNLPLVVEYRRISLQNQGSAKRKLMVSTYFKTQEEKNGAAEAVSYYSASAVFDGGGRFTLIDFGGKDYGHPLCYYTRAYAGETLRLTVYPSELHKVDNNTVKALSSSVTAIGGLPMFAQFLPYLSLAKAGVNIFATILNLFHHDDVYSVVSCDLHFNQPDARILQSGRFVCVPDIDGSQPVTDAALIGRYRLTPDSQLVSTADGAEFAGSYFVIALNAVEDKAYEKFDYFQSAAALLELTNRGGDLGTLLNEITSYGSSFNDMDIVKRIEALRPKASDPDIQKQAAALFQTLSSDMKLIYQDRFNSAFPPPHA
jgi:hypothetical protein